MRLVRLRSAALAVGVALASACGGTPPDAEGPGGPEREAFIGTYVDLRLAALRSGGNVDVRARETVLANHGVSEQELLDFAETHGRDIAYMNDIWQEVERRLDSIRAEGDQEG